MSNMFTQRPQILSILDAGAGVGSLSAALIEESCRWKPKPARIMVTACEIEPILIEYLKLTLDHCRKVCLQENIEFDYNIISDDFIKASIEMLNGGFLSDPLYIPFNAIIINPPYKKINSKSNTRKLLRKLGIETSNLYAAFLWIAIKLLDNNGEIVSITPRSFCNGPYFLPFRTFLLDSVSIQRIHVFDRRDVVFSEDDVLQENIILHAIKFQKKERVVISTSSDLNDERVTIREVPYSQVVRLDDPYLFIHIVTDTLDQQMCQCINLLETSLNDLGICVSTGRVVDFRAKRFLREIPEKDTAPLIYPHNFSEGCIVWPGKRNKKPCAIKIEPETENLFIPQGWYVLVRRFSAKEEKTQVSRRSVRPIKNRSNLYWY